MVGSFSQRTNLWNVDDGAKGASAEKSLEKQTLRTLYTYCIKELGNTDGREIFTFVTGKRVYDLPFVGEKTASPAQWQQALCLCRRRKAGEPLQYVIGGWDFYGLTLSVGPGVLIPRSDTETVVTTALELLKSVPAPTVLDLCTGSGAIALALATQRNDAIVTALELSPQAFCYFTENNNRYGQRVHGLLHDVMTYRHPEPVDLIVSNPPYIPTEDLAGLQQEVQAEPVMALDGGEDGLDFYRSITHRYKDQLVPGGHLVFEVGIHQRQTVMDILKSHGFIAIDSAADVSGISRVVHGKKP